MKLYSDYPVARTAQIVSDLVAAAAIVLSVIVAIAVHGAIAVFADFGRQLEGSGDDFRSTMADAAEQLGDLPLVGDGVRPPFDQASEAGQASPRRVATSRIWCRRPRCSPRCWSPWCRSP